MRFPSLSWLKNTKKLENSASQEWFLLSVLFLTPVSSVSVSVSVWPVGSVSVAVGMSGIPISSISSISIMSIVSISFRLGISRSLGNNVGGSNCGDTVGVGSVGVWVSSNTVGIWVVGSSSIGVSCVASIGQSRGSDGLNLSNSGIFISLGSLDNSVHSGQAIGETVSTIGIWVAVTSIEDCGVSFSLGLRGGIGSGKQTNLVIKTVVISSIYYYGVAYNKELHLELC